jgi:hypothetical protein
VAGEAIDPWRDPKNYKTGKIVRCYGCKGEARKTHWGNWCFDCNVERIERISKNLADLVK